MIESFACSKNGFPMQALSRGAGQVKASIWLVFPRLFKRVAGTVQLCYCFRFDNYCRREFMRVPYLFSLVLCASAAGQAAPAFSATQQLTVPNFDAASPACVVRVPVNGPACTPAGCTIQPPKRSTLVSIQLNFSCLPKAAPTGFEHPVEGAKVQSLRAGKAAGDLSLIDDLQAPLPERLRELNFCLYGKRNNFCGNAKVLRLADGAKADASGTIKAFIRSIELQDR